jgi:ankyrin repeat protein
MFLLPRTQMGSIVVASRRKSRDVLAEKKNGDHFVIEMASKSKLSNSVDLWISSLASQIRDGSYPLHMAIAAGAPRIVVERILQESGDALSLTNKHGETPLHIALARTDAEDADAIAILAGNDSSIARVKEKLHGNLPIHTAATHGCSVQVAKTLLEIHPSSILEDTY